MSLVSGIIIGTMAGLAILILLYTCVFFLDRKPYILLWVFGWAMYLGNNMFRLLYLAGGTRYITLVGDNLLLVLSNVAIVYGIHDFFSMDISKLWKKVAGIVILLVLLAPILKINLLVYKTLIRAFCCAIYVITGHRVLKYNCKNIICCIMGIALIIWGGVHALNPISIILRKSYISGSYMIASYIIVAGLGLAVAFSFLILYFQRITQNLASSLKANENLLKISLEYESLKSNFLINMSHEFRTPINVISGTVQLIDKICNENCACNKERINKYVPIMNKNCNRLLKLVDNLIDITKLDAKNFDMKFHNHNIVKVVEDITFEAARYIKKKDISLVFDTDIEEKFVACDAEKIERIILNLLSNAVKFTQPHGKITVDIQDKGEQIIISVADTGIGIPQDKYSDIFQPFGQVDRELRRCNEGSGVGLSLVQYLVELHGGTISFDSELGIGSRFTIKLPVKVVEDDEVAISKDDWGYGNRVDIEFSDVYL